MLAEPSYVQRDRNQTLYTRRSGISNKIGISLTLNLPNLQSPRGATGVSYIWSFLAGVEYGNSTYGLSSNLRGY